MQLFVYMYLLVLHTLVVTLPMDERSGPQLSSIWYLAFGDVKLAKMLAEVTVAKGHYKAKISS